jgi:hypothetical protein
MIEYLFDTIFGSAIGPGVLAARIAQIEFWRQPTSDLELIGDVALSECEVITIIAPLEGLCIIC